MVLQNPKKLLWVSEGTKRAWFMLLLCTKWKYENSTLVTGTMIILPLCIACVKVFLWFCFLTPHTVHKLVKSLPSEKRMDSPRHVVKQEHRKAGLFWRLDILRIPRTHPSLGGTRGYGVEMCEDQLWLAQNGFPIRASQLSIQRWTNCLYPYLMSGNKQREVLVGMEWYMLHLFLIAWPDAMLDNIISFIANSGTGRVYSWSQVCRRLFIELH